MKDSLNEVKKQELIIKIIEWICDGFDKKEIGMKVAASINLDEDEINSLIDEAITRIIEIQKKERPNIIKQHVANYERIYSYFRSIGHAAGCNKAMQAKERLLGLLKDGENKVTLKKSETIIHKRPNVEYDINRLTLEEQEKFKSLMAKISE